MNLLIKNGQIIIPERTITQCGYTRTFKRRMVKPWKHTNGYLIFSYKFEKYYVHRFIWEYYNGSIPDGYVIHHRDENIYNNDISNLELKLQSDHTRDHGTGKHTPLPTLRKRIICVNTGEIFDSVAEAAKFYNRANGSISRVLTGSRDHCGGLIWKYC